LIVVTEIAITRGGKVHESRNEQQVTGVVRLGLINQKIVVISGRNTAIKQRKEKEMS
jgi:hypothetical protein